MINLDKIRIIIEVANQHMKKYDSYRFACTLNKHEINSLRENFIVDVESNFDDKVILTLKPKKNA